MDCSNRLRDAPYAGNLKAFIKRYILANKHWLRVYEIENGLREVFIRSDLLRKMFCFDCFAHIYVHRKIVILNPFLWNSL
jgi:hypothetical protein